MDLFEFWSDLPEDSGIHPADKPILDANPGHGFILEVGPDPMPPGPINGPLKTARVVLCYGNPGFDMTDDGAIAQDKQKRERLVRQLRGTEPLPADLTKGWKNWFARILGSSGSGKPLEADLREDIAVFNVVPYASASMNDRQERIAVGLPSVWAAQKHLREVLIPRAREGELFLVIMRKRHLWGVTDGIQVTNGIRSKTLCLGRIDGEAGFLASNQK